MDDRCKGFLAKVNARLPGPPKRQHHCLPKTPGKKKHLLKDLKVSKEIDIKLDVTKHSSSNQNTPPFQSNEDLFRPRPRKGSGHWTPGFRSNPLGTLGTKAAPKTTIPAKSVKTKQPAKLKKSTSCVASANTFCKSESRGDVSRTVFRQNDSYLYILFTRAIFGVFFSPPISRFNWAWLL